MSPAFNCSPKMDKGNTSLILNPMISGMRKAGADVSHFFIKKLEIKPCLGDLSCMLKNPGKYVQNDDMKTLYPVPKETHETALYRD